MNKDSTPSWQQLIDWIEGRLEEGEAEHVQQLLAQSDEGSLADVAWIDAFLRARNEIVLDEPPAELRRNLRAQFAQYADRQDENTGVAGIFQRLAAMLVFDSGLQPGLTGARSGESAPLRQLVYSSDLLDISLGIRDEEKRLIVDGQMLPNRPLTLDAFQVHLERAAQVVHSAPVDASGHFSFADLAPDTYQLVLSSPDMSISIESLDLRG